MGRREAEHETETTPASQKTPVMDVSRQARAVSVSFGPRNGKTGAAQVSTNPQNSTTRAAQVSTNPRNGKTGAAQVSTSTQNSTTGAAQVSTSPQNSTTGAARVSYAAVGASKRTGGADTTAALGRAVGTCPAITPWTHHPACPLPLRPIALWCRRSMKCHTHPECTRLSPLTEPPARVRGALRSGDSRDCSTPPQEA